MSRHWSKIGEAGALTGMRFMIWIDKVIGPWAYNFILIFLMAYFYLRRGDARRASFDYLGRVRREYPNALGRGPIAWYSYRQFFTFGLSLRDKYMAWAESPQGIDMVAAEEHMLFQAAASEKGCLMIGSHFGNLEYSRGIAHRHPGLTINVLIYDRHATKFAALIAQVEPESRMHLIQVTDVDIELALKLKSKVDAGEWVVIAGDRVPVGDSTRVCEAEFFGHAARFPIGPYVLATLLQCPVYLLHCYRLNDKYHLGMARFADEIRPARTERNAAYQQHAQRFATALEEQVARAPLQWFNFYDFWSSESGTASTPASQT
jgi:predicted LPLAT superfamily acyltransferase